MPIAKIEVLRKIADSGLVCVIRADSPEQASRIADACVDEGRRGGGDHVYGSGRERRHRASSQELRRPGTVAAGLAHAHKWRQH